MSLLRGNVLRRDVWNKIRARQSAAWWCVCAASVAAAVLAMLFLGSKSFWLDEAESVAFADVRRHIWHVAFDDGGNFAVYYLLLHMWLRYGSSDAYIRLLSVIPSILSVPLIFVVGRSLFGARAGVLAALLLAINPFFIRYAQEARGYSLLMLGSVVTTLLFMRCLDAPKSRLNPCLYVMASVLMVYNHFFGVFVLAAHGFGLLFWDRRRVPWLAVIVSAASIVVLLLPIAYVARQQGAAQIAWIDPISARTILAFSASISGSVFLFSLYVGIGMYGVSRALRRGGLGRDAVGLRSVGFALSWFSVPIVLAALFSELVTPIFVSRYLIVTLPPLVVLAAAVLSRIGRPAIFAAVLAGMIALSGQGLWSYYFDTPKEDWRGVASFIGRHARPGDVVVCYPWFMVTALQHAVERSRLGRFPDLIVPPHRPSTTSPSNTPPLSVHEFLADLASSRRVWLVSRSNPEEVKGKAVPQLDVSDKGSLILRSVAQRRRLSGQESFERIDVFWYDDRREGAVSSTTSANAVPNAAAERRTASSTW